MPKPVVELKPSEAALSAEVVGVDLSNPLSAEVIAAIRAALITHCVLVFRHQSLSESDQIRFTARFGEPAKHIREYPVRSQSEIFVVSNITENGKPIGALGSEEVDFHSDLSYLPKPGTISMLYAVELPKSGSQTQWASGYAAYEALDDLTQARIATLKAVHRHRDEYQNPVVPSEHPIVRHHPESGRLALFVTPFMTRSIVGMGSDESEQLLRQLNEHITRPEFVWTHDWQPGDLVMWDNRATCHRRLAFPASERRLLKRTQLFGNEVPAGLPN